MNLPTNVTLRPLGNGQVRVEFRHWPENPTPLFSFDVPESQVEAKIQELQGTYELQEKREQEIERRLYAELPSEFIPDGFGPKKR